MSFDQPVNISGLATPLAGKVAVVTGGTRGLGLAITNALSAAGASVVAASRQVNTPAAEPAVSGIRYEHVDVANRDSVRNLFKRTDRRFGRVDITIANAGVSRNSRIADTSDDDWQTTIETNLTGTFHTIREAAKVMKPRKAGRILTVSSCMASRPAVGAGAYSVSKAGIEALTRAAAQELAPDGILVNCIAPGILDLGMGEAVAAEARLWSRYRKHLSLGRPGRASEVASLVQFLAGPDSTYINGAVVPIDGGLNTWT